MAYPHAAPPGGKAAAPAGARPRHRRWRVGWVRAILLLALFVTQTAAQTPPADTHGMTQPPQPATDVGETAASARPSAAIPDDAPLPHDGAPRWLEAVRAQRRALQESRRAQHQARRRAIDPVGTARQEAMEQEFQRRRQELRDLMAHERRLFLNLGPWLTPWPPPGSAPPTPGTPSPETPAAPGDATSASPRSAYELPDWDNGWYFRGW
jgi:hypothetical protein